MTEGIGHGDSLGGGWVVSYLVPPSNKRMGASLVVRTTRKRVSCWESTGHGVHQCFDPEPMVVEVRCCGT